MHPYPFATYEGFARIFRLSYIGVGAVIWNDWLTRLHEHMGHMPVVVKMVALALDEPVDGVVAGEVAVGWLC